MLYILNISWFLLQWFKVLMFGIVIKVDFRRLLCFYFVKENLDSW